MVQTIVTPRNVNFEMTVILPSEYIGKKVRVFFFVDDEVSTINAAIAPSKKPSDFFGTMSEEEGKKMHEYIIHSRNEWERDI